MSKICSKINNYRLQQENTLDFSCIWYIMDEIGSSMVRSNDANMEVFPFLFNKNNDIKEENVAYSICWNNKNISENQIISRDFLKGISEQQFRSARLHCWYNIPKDYFILKYKQRESQLQLQQTLNQPKYQEIKLSQP